MSKIDDLIQEYCPDGVEYKELREVADFIRGKGLCKDDIGLGNVPVILYGELYTTYNNYINKGEIFMKQKWIVYKEIRNGTPKPEK